MAGKADGSIIIDTEIETDGFKAGKKEVESAARNMAKSISQIGDSARITLEKQVNAFVKQNQMYDQQVKKVDELKKKLDELKGQKIPTEEYAKLEKELGKLTSEYDKLAEKQYRFTETGGKEGTTAYKRMEYDLDRLDEKQNAVIAKMKEMESSGTAYTAADTSGAEEKYLAALQKQQQMHEALGTSYDALKVKAESLGASMGDISNTIEGEAASSREYVGVMQSMLNGLKMAAHAPVSAVQALGGALKTLPSRAVSTLSSGMKMLGNNIKKLPVKVLHGLFSAMEKLGSAAKNAAGFIGRTLVSALKKAKSGMQDVDKQTTKTKSSFSTFGKRIKELLLSALIFNRISSALNSMVNGTKEGLNNLVMYSDRVNNSMSMLMSSMTRLKNSFATAFAPILNVVAPILSRFINLLSEAATKVGMFFAALTGQTTFEKAVAVQQDYRDSLNGTAKAQKKANKEQDKYLSGLDEIRRWESNKDEDEEDDLTPEDMFTTVPVENEMSDLANKVKDIFDQIFAPLKEAWNREGKFVMDSWKYALGEIWKLAKDIGRDFLKVWNQEATISMLSNMLHIIGDIGLVVGNLAGKFREAWNANNTGLHILENIRDIFAVIVGNLREAADYTVEWSKTLDFTPLLQGIERLTASLVPFFDFVSGTLADFYTEFILPLTSWTLSEAGLPRLLNILASFMELIDWQALRSAFKELYSAFEPYAEEIGTGLLDFIEKMKDEGVEFFNFLPGAISRAAEALRNGDLPTAFEEFGSISGEAVKHAFNLIKIAIESINWGEIGTLIASFINGIDWIGVGNSFFGALASAVNAAIDLIYNFITTTDWRAIGTQLGTSLSNAWASIDWKQAGAMVGEAFRAFFDFIATTIESIDWYMVGQTVKDFLVGIDWASVASAFFEAIGAALGGLGAFLGGVITDGVNSAVVYFQDKIEECGGNVVLGILKGILDAVVGIGQWIYDHIFKPFIDGFKKAFGIHSPSTVMEEQGKYIMEGLISGISSLVNKVVSIFGDIKKNITDKWKEIKQNTKETWENVKTNIKESWENIKINVKNGADSAKTNIKTAWDSIKTNSSSTWNSIKTSVTGTWDNLKTSSATKFDGIKRSVLSAWDGARSNSTTAWNGITNVLTSTWDNLRNTASSSFGGISSVVLSAWDGLKQNTSNAWNGLVGIIKSPINSIIGFLNGMIRAVATMVNNIAQMLNSIHVDIPDWVPKIGGGKLGFNLPTWTPGQIPYLASGAVIPPNKEFMAVLGDQKHGNNIEAPESLLRKIVREEMRGNQSGGGSYRFTANLNRRVIFDEIIEEAKLRQTASGRNPFEMA